MSADVNTSQRNSVPLRPLEIPNPRLNGQDATSNLDKEGREGYTEGICRCENSL